ncbi:ribosome-associated translation inhibitor RaiA [Patescibacteria group bacterium]|nr:MAG: ribosome-associated translation inhibitor RaiA [Patescibacteria group bacterium]
MDIAKMKAGGFELTPAIAQYAEEKIRHMEKFLSSVQEPKRASIEVEKTTNHHNKGQIFRAEVMLELPGKTLRAEATDEDLYAAIDAMKDALERQVIQYKETR